MKFFSDVHQLQQHLLRLSFYALSQLDMRWERADNEESGESISVLGSCSDKERGEILSTPSLHSEI